MRRVRRRDSLRREMTPDVEVGRVFLLLDRLMVPPRFLERLLLGAAVLIQDPVARFKFVPDPRDIFVHDGQLCLGCRQFLPGHPACFRAAEAGARDFRSFLRQDGRGATLIAAICASRSAGGGTCACSSDSFFNRSRSAASFSWSRRSTAGQFAIAKIGCALRVVSPLAGSAFFSSSSLASASFCSFAFCSRCSFDFPDAFLDLRDPERDFLLFLLEFLQRDDFVADLREN